MIKRLFDWTPRDIAYWEKIQTRGKWKFILWYGVGITGGVLFLVFGLITFVQWFRQFSEAYNTSASLFILFGQLLFTAVVCLVAGILNGVITWLVEERQYRKYKDTGEDEGD
jgi:hypothetical protein